MGKFLGVVFIVCAIISLIFFTALDPDDQDDDPYEDSIFLESKDNPGSTYDHDLYADRDTEIRLTFSSDQGPIRVILKNRNNGNDNILAEESDSGDFEHYFDEAGDYTIRFENNQDQSTRIHYSLTTKGNDNEATRGVCGIFIVIFLILGIIFLVRKGGKKGPSIIHARQMLHPQFPSSPDQSSKRSDDLTPQSMFAPPSFQDIKDADRDDDGPQPVSPFPTTLSSGPAQERTPPGSLGYQDSQKPAPAFPMPKDTSKHESHFRCPDCGTVIFINRKIKKVHCPKCSHTFKVEKPV